MDPIFLNPPALKLEGNYDRVFASGSNPDHFLFDEEVALVFDNMVSRSVPLYKEVQEAMVYWAKLFWQKGTRIYDLGCSTGTSLHSLCAAFQEKLNLVGVDTSQAMILRAECKLAPYQNTHQISLLAQDVTSLEFQETSFVIANYLFQFIPVEARPKILRRIFEALVPGGILYCSEKIRFEDPLMQETITTLYELYKRKQGYSQEEVERKKAALEDVLLPLTTQEHQSLFHEAGFKIHEPILKWHNFVTYVVAKS